MALQIVTGPSGAGKSHILYEELIRDSIAHPERNYLVLVPEQFTMQTQDDLVRRSPRKGLLNVDVLSFNRLAHRVFGEVGGNTRPILDDLGKSLVVQKVIAKTKNELGTLRRALTRRGAAEQMKSVLAELMQYRVTPADLDDWRESLAGRTLLEGKLADIQTVYQGFCDYLEDKYLTSEELLQVLCEVMGKSSLLSGSTVVMDGFTGFTPVQYEVIRELLRLCADVTIILTADANTDLMRKGGAHRLFHMSCQSAQRLAEIAREVGAELLPPRKIEPCDRSRHAANPELAFLERHLFRHSKETCDAEMSSVFVSEAGNPADEILAAAEVIRRRVREEGLRYADFALVTGDLATYGRLAEQIFPAAEIPHFLDNKKPVWSNALVELVRAAMDLMTRRHSYASVMRLLRCEFFGFERDDVDRLENYVLALGIRGRNQYEEVWTRQSRRTETAELKELNSLRARFVEATEAFVEETRKASTVTERTKALYALLVRLETQARCKKKEERATEAGDTATAREYAQIYPRVIDLLDRLVEVLGDERVSMSEYQQLLEAGFAELRLGFVPPGEDQVLIGDIERTRLAHVKVLFIAGVNEGIIPRPVSDAGLLSEPDRLLLAQQDIELAPTAREEIARQRFYLYLNMTKASQALYLSYSLTDTAGAARAPSYLIGAIRRLFPSLRVRLLSSDRKVSDLLETPQGREQILLAGVRGEKEKEGAFRELARFLETDAAGKELLSRLYAAAGSRNRNKELGTALALALYGNEIRNSATRLEQFASCPFAHFAKYGLRLAEREQYDFTQADLGTILHDALQRFTDKVREKQLDWASLKEEERDRFADESLDEIAHGYGNAILSSSNRNRFLIERIRRMLKKTVWVLQRQLAKGRFQVGAAEEAFAERQERDTVSLDLPEGMRMQLVGKIDRLDICEDNGTRYLKVIDYKTGHTTLDLNLVLEGMQLQLALYLNAALEREKKKDPQKHVEPAGMFYYHVDDPILKEVTDENTEEEILRELRLDGLARSETGVLRLFDTTLEPGTRSDVIPVALKKDNTPDARSHVGNEAFFQTMRKFADIKARELARGIAEGCVEARPGRGKKRVACTWCVYRSLCGFDERIPGYQYRNIPERSTDEVRAEMEEKTRSADPEEKA